MKKRISLFLIALSFWLAFPQGMLADLTTAGAPVFLDVASDHPHFEAIQALSARGVIQGYSNNTFRPDQLVNRAEALKIILLGSDILVPEIQPQTLFPDVTGEVWYGKYVAKAKNLNIIRGDEGTGLFRPGDTINLAEILKVLLKANTIQVKTPQASPYADVPPDSWFAPYFDYARFIGLLDQSSNEAVHPDQAINRGMMAELLYRLSLKPQADDYGKASFYGGKFHGRTTASGDIFDASAFTAAHRRYAFGTWLKVTAIDNGKSVVVRVNDRGPYTKDGRVIDLSQAAFEAIAPLSRGVIQVTIERTKAPEKSAKPPPETTPLLEAPEMPTPDESPSPAANLLQTRTTVCPEKNNLGYLNRTAFESITLTRDVPNMILVDERLILQGSITTPLSGAPKVTAFFVDSADKQQAFPAEVVDSKFTISISFPDRGTYKLGLIPGAEGTSLVQTVNVLPYACIQEREKSTLKPPALPTLALEDGDTKIRWKKGGYNIFHLSLIQKDHFKRFILHEAQEFKPLYKDFEEFVNGPTTFQLRGGILNGKALLEADTIEWSPPVSLTFNAITHEDYILEKDHVEVLALPKDVRLNESWPVSFKPKTAIREEAAVITPTGEVKTVNLKSASKGAIKNKNDISIFPASEENLTLTFKPTETGLHFLEINDEEGLAAINIPVYEENAFPLLPNFTEIHERKAVELGNDLAALRTQFLELVNRDRALFGRSSLTLDTALNTLAQARTDDMAQQNYFSHWDKEGRDVNDLRGRYGVNQIVSENMAKEVSPEFAEVGLMRSAIHRDNLLSNDWTRLGIGISKNSDGTYMFVQLFSEDPLDLQNLDAVRTQLLGAINKNRSSVFAVSPTLQQIAQTWSMKMAEDDFFAFEDETGAALADSINAAHLNARVGTAIFGNARFSGLLDQLTSNSALKESHWVNLGIGIKQDRLGVFKVTLIYSE